MHQQILHVCRSYLERTYRERLGYALGDSLADGAVGRQAAWRTVTASDFTSRASEGADRAGLLLDPEVGILLYLVPFFADSRLSVHVNRALRIRSQLSIERNYSAAPSLDCDPNGAWRVSICWLVEAETDKQRWLDQIIELRKGTMFSEEVSLDAVFLTAGAEEKAMEAHGFPCLLLTSRQILQKDDAGAVTQWLRADKAVRTALKGFEASFETSAQKALAAEIVRELDRTSDGDSTAAANAPAEGPAELQSLRILNFRNLGDVSFEFGSNPVAATVIHGPNGTGKSSVCEALSIALFGSSYRYSLFADHDREKDLTTINRPSEYVAKYLTGIESRGAEPRLGLNGATPASVRLVSRDKLFETELAMSGTVLTQDTSLEFARMQADQLGARVLRNYSELAERLENYAEEKYQSANSARQDYLRSLNLSAAITLLDTAYARLASREIGRLVPGSLDSHLSWLAQLDGFRWKGAPQGLLARWREWSGEMRRSALAGALTSNRTAESITCELRSWLESYNTLVTGSTEVVRAIERGKEGHGAVLAEAETKLRVLIEWRSRRSPTVLAAAPKEGDAVRAKLGDLQKRQQKIVQTGQDTRARLEHLNQVEVFVTQTWSKLHPNECPTCGVDHAEHGGVLNVIRNLKADAALARDRLRDEFATVKAEIDAAQKTLSSFGQAQSPISADELGALTAALQWLLPDGSTLDACLDDGELRQNLLALVECMRTMPPLPQAIDVEAQTSRVTQTLLFQYHEAETIFQAPDNWKPIRAKLTETLARVVREHLPGTLAGLWVEIAMNLTSAVWLLPDRPAIEVVPHRGEKKSTLRLKGRLVRYILNQSEIHVLGLAWFFTRYLTHGRFHHAALVMDDPAQEMDQTTFREFCRLLETLCRLHRVYAKPLKLVVLLNQESRALDIARATSGMAHLLGWVPEQNNSISVLNVVTPGFFAPLPTRLFTTATAN